jgi:DNA-binding LytR/AlgR family response regulator
MQIKFTHVVYSFKEDVRLLLSISFGVFLFLLFFQPFPLEKFDFNNRLLIELGLGAIVFLFLALVRFLLQWLKQQYEQTYLVSSLSAFTGGFIITALTSVAFAFYLRYVGQVPVSFFVIIKIVLICLAPPAALWQYDKIAELKEQNELLQQENELIRLKVEQFEEDLLNKSITLISESSSETLSLVIADIAFVRSADNYVEVAWKEGEIIRKKLLRNTLRNIEQQIKSYSNFIRCHRTCIINTHFVDKLERNYSSYWLILKGYADRIPVSRQYLLKLKESI